MGKSQRGDAIKNLLPEDGSWVSLADLIEQTRTLVNDAECAKFHKHLIANGGIPTYSEGIPDEEHVRRGRRLLIQKTLDPACRAGRFERRGSRKRDNWAYRRAAGAKPRQKREKPTKKTTGTVELRLDQIRTDGETQARASINSETVAEYATHYTNGVSLPAAVVFFDRKEHWLADGHHRVRARKQAGFETHPFQGVRLYDNSA
jgi:hypothetical protein